VRREGAQKARSLQTNCHKLFILHEPFFFYNFFFFFLLSFTLQWFMLEQEFLEVVWDTKEMSRTKAKLSNYLLHERAIILSLNSYVRQISASRRGRIYVELLFTMKKTGHCSHEASHIVNTNRVTKMTATLMPLKRLLKLWVTANGKN
jgi:hypothetical protein